MQTPYVIELVHTTESEPIPPTGKLIGLWIKLILPEKNVELTDSLIHDRQQVRALSKLLFMLAFHSIINGLELLHPSD